MLYPQILKGKKPYVVKDVLGNSGNIGYDIILRGAVKITIDNP